MVADVGFGSFSTVMRDESDFGGYPFSSVDLYAEDCSSKTGDLILFLSPLEVNWKNFDKNNKVSMHISEKGQDSEKSPDPLFRPRMTILGSMEKVEEAEEKTVRDCYMNKHPEAQAWEDMPSHKFSWYRMKVEGVNWIGGFGDKHYIGMIEAAVYRSAKKGGEEAREEEEKGNVLFV